MQSNNTYYHHYKIDNQLITVTSAKPVATIKSFKKAIRIARGDA